MHAASEPPGEITGLEAAIDGNRRPGILRQGAQSSGRGYDRRVIRATDVECEGGRDAVALGIADREGEWIDGRIARLQGIDSRRVVPLVSPRWARWASVSAVVAAVLIFQFRVGMIPTFAACCLAGIASYFVGAIG